MCSIFSLGSFDPSTHETQVALHPGWVRRKRANLVPHQLRVHRGGAARAPRPFSTSARGVSQVSRAGRHGGAPGSAPGRRSEGQAGAGRVPATGVEPARSEEQSLLRGPCLPVPPRRRLHDRSATTEARRPAGVGGGLRPLVRRRRAPATAVGGSARRPRRRGRWPPPRPRSCRRAPRAGAGRPGARPRAPALRPGDGGTAARRSEAGCESPGSRAPGGEQPGRATGPPWRSRRRLPRPPSWRPAATVTPSAPASRPDSPGRRSRSLVPPRRHGLRQCGRPRPPPGGAGTAPLPQESSPTVER